MTARTPDSPGLALPLSAATAWGLTAWLRGLSATDDLLDLMSDGLRCVVHTPEGDTSLLDLLADLRSRGVRAAGLAMPREGDPLGLGGPPSFNAEALEAGEAVVAGEIGLVPWVDGDTMHWQVHACRRRQVPDLDEASRTLRLDLIHAADGLAALDVASWRPEVADLLIDLRASPVLEAPPGTPAKAVDLVARGLVATAVVDLALLDDGGAVSVTEMGRRRDLLTPLSAAGRRALVAGCSPEVWPEDVSDQRQG